MVKKNQIINALNTLKFIIKSDLWGVERRQFLENVLDLFILKLFLCLRVCFYFLLYLLLNICVLIYEKLKYNIVQYKV